MRYIQFFIFSLSFKKYDIYLPFIYAQRLQKVSTYYCIYYSIYVLINTKYIIFRMR